MKLLFLLFIGLVFPQLYNCDKKITREYVQASDVILIAEVAEVQSPPNFWSGTAPAIQKVKYKVEKVLKGNISEREVVVEHYVVKNSSTADTDYPQLSQKLFTVGTHFILLLKTNSGTQDRYIAFSENHSAITANDKCEKMIKKIIRSDKDNTKK